MSDPDYEHVHCSDWPTYECCACGDYPAGQDDDDDEIGVDKPPIDGMDPRELEEEDFPIQVISGEGFYADESPGVLERVPRLGKPYPLVSPAEEAKRREEVRQRVLPYGDDLREVYSEFYGLEGISDKQFVESVLSGTPPEHPAGTLTVGALPRLRWWDHLFPFWRAAFGKDRAWFK